MQSRIYRKKYLNGSVNSEGHLKKTRHDADSGLDVYIYVIKSPIQLVRQSLSYKALTGREYCAPVLDFVPLLYNSIIICNMYCTVHVSPCVLQSAG